ncbi:MAG: sigma-54 dependent transcriptional regulator [Clostridiales Family XIII bacterium]|jgi:two-component system nitrogen regulation response regulator NtrX|nr:sigma-54 dependent transcriptional regulator [Clostridiales Family XIII bacterium]
MKTFVSNNRKIFSILEKIKTAAPTDMTVLITGESGTGKEILADRIHCLSDRADKPFIKVNCAALSQNLLESELFGHEKGAYTGADRTRKGRFEMADAGTILLDEIGELPLSAQAKLLRVLEEKEVERVGSSATIRTDFRLIAATNKDLRSEATHGRFRRDLLYRINGFSVELPPLRERPEDILPLVEFFADRFGAKIGKRKPVLTPAAEEVLLSYAWPGNARELKNVVELLVVMRGGEEASKEDLPDDLREKRSGARAFSGNPAGLAFGGDVSAWVREGVTLREARRRFEKEYIVCALARNAQNVTRTAEKLDIAKKNLYRKMKDCDIAFNLSSLRSATDG